MRFRLRTLLMVLALLAGVVVFGTAMATSSSLALKDALLERLDGPAVAALAEYCDDTWASRAVAYGSMAGFWAGVGIALGWFIVPRPTNTTTPTNTSE